MERRESMPWLFLKRTSTWNPFTRTSPVAQDKDVAAAPTTVEMMFGTSKG